MLWYYCSYINCGCQVLTGSIFVATIWRMARPPKDPSQVRNVTIRFRATADEERIFAAAAALKRPQSELSQWMRETLWAEAERVGATKGVPGRSLERPPKRRHR